MSSEKPTIFFDGVCHLCNSFVDAVIQRDPAGQFVFAPIQGETAEKMLTPEERSRIETVILIAGGIKYHRSEAVLRVLVGLGGRYKFFLLGFIIPTFLRDKIYAWVARHRYAWFGQRDFCRLPEAHERQRLLP
jgi:predicted DCC family thiol-disulfide oxidoreductase YuxK